MHRSKWVLLKLEVTSCSGNKFCNFEDGLMFNLIITSTLCNSIVQKVVGFTKQINDLKKSGVHDDSIFKFLNKKNYYQSFVLKKITITHTQIRYCYKLYKLQYQLFNQINGSFVICYFDSLVIPLQNCNIV